MDRFLPQKRVMAKYTQDTKDCARSLEKYIGKELTKDILSKIYFESIKTMPWRGAVRKVKVTAGQVFASQVGSKVKVVQRTGRDGGTYEDLDFVEEETVEENG